MDSKSRRDGSHVHECGPGAIDLCRFMTRDERKLDAAMRAVEPQVEALYRSRRGDAEIEALARDWKQLAVAVIEIATDARVYHDLFVHGPDGTGPKEVPA